jgi:hypothetical protein
MQWVDEIAKLYQLNALRLQAPAESSLRAVRQNELEQAVDEMAQRRERELTQPQPLLAGPAAQVLQSMAAHWSGLTVFVEHAHVPMDMQRGRTRCQAGGGGAQELLRLAARSGRAN